MTWYAGLDLGKVRDSTALSILEPAGPRLALTYLRTWKPERDDCIDALGEVLRLIDRDQPAGVSLALDARGLGAAAARAALEGEVGRRLDVYPVLPSFSPRPHRQRPDGYIWAGKAHLVGALFVALEQDRIRFGRGLCEKDALLDELARLRAIPTKGGTAWTYSHPTQRQHDHDDRVMSVALALFVHDNSTRTGLTDPLRVRPANRRTAWTNVPFSSE